MVLHQLINHQIMIQIHMVHLQPITLHLHQHQLLVIQQQDQVMQCQHQHQLLVIHNQDQVIHNQLQLQAILHLVLVILLPHQQGQGIKRQGTLQVLDIQFQQHQLQVIQFHQVQVIQRHQAQDTQLHHLQVIQLHQAQDTLPLQMQVILRQLITLLLVQIILLINQLNQLHSDHQVILPIHRHIQTRKVIHLLV